MSIGSERGAVQSPFIRRVKRSRGYQEVSIATPTRYRAAQTRTP
jgi:hypothetical protein